MGNQAGLMNPLLRWAPLAIGLTFFAAWEAASRLELISPLFFPAPTFVLETVLTMILDGELGIHVMATMTRVLAGFILGSALGLTLGMYMGWSRATRQVIDPLIAAIHPIPKISIFPLIMIVFGIGVLSKIVVVSVAAFFFRWLLIPWPACARFSQSTSTWHEIMARVTGRSSRASYCPEVCR